jgi:flavodoxin
MPTPAFRTVILCDSVHHQNTAKIARAIAEPLAARVLEPEQEQASQIQLDQYDLIGFGSGVYFGRLHAALFAWLDNLPDKLPAEDNTYSKPAFIFSTSGLSFLAAFWHAPLKAKLTQKGFDVIAEFHCRGFDTWGPLRLVGGINKSHPDQHDLEQAAFFAHRLLDSCQLPATSQH